MTSVPAAGGTVSITTIADAPAGSLIVVWLASRDPSFPRNHTVTDSAGNHSSGDWPPALGGGLDSSGSNGVLEMRYTYNCLHLPIGGTITYTNTDPTLTFDVALSALVWTTARTSSDPYEITASNVNAGSSAAPTCTLLAVPPTANSLITCAVGWQVGGGGGGFVQDSSNGAYATPPNENLTGAIAVAGGSIISSAQLTYAPAINNSAWADGMAVFSPEPVSSTILMGQAVF